jgi:hypothetical protein
LTTGLFSLGCWLKDYLYRFIPVLLRNRSVGSRTVPFFLPYFCSKARLSKGERAKPCIDVRHIRPTYIHPLNHSMYLMNH